MSFPARKIEMEHKMYERTALDEKVDHIQSDVTELKADVKRLEAKVDEKFGTLSSKMDEKIGALDSKVDEKFGTLSSRMDEKIGALDSKLDGKVDGLNARVDAVTASLADHRVETEKSFGQVRDEIGKVRLEMRDAFAQFRRDRTVQIAWIIGVVIAAVGGASGLERFFAPRPTPPAHETSREGGQSTPRANGADTSAAQEQPPHANPSAWRFPRPDSPRFTRISNHVMAAESTAPV
jgi:hypothetical protein